MRSIVLALALVPALALAGCASSGASGGWKIVGGTDAAYPREMSRGEPGTFDLSLEVGIIPGTATFEGRYDAPLAKGHALTLAWNGTPLAERGTSPVVEIGAAKVSCAQSASSEGDGYAATVTRTEGRCEVRLTLTKDQPRLDWRWGAPPAGTVQLEFHDAAA